MKVAFSAEARSDLQEIGDWIVQDNRQRARTFVHELRTRCGALASRANRFPIVRQVGGIAIRRVVHGAYLILFEVDPRRNSVLIVRVLHGARDHDAILRPDEDEP